MNDDGADVLAEDLRVAVGRFVRATRARADALPLTHSDVLGQLDRGGPQTIRQLAAARGVRHQGMSRAVQELERAGLVHRAADPGDARASRIALADAGAAALAADRSARRGLLADRIRERLTDEQVRALEAVPALLTALAD